MNFICEKCEADLDDDVDAVMLLKRPDMDDRAFCLDKVRCAEEGAELAVIAARRLAIDIKPDRPPEPNAEEPSGDPQ